MSKSTTSGSTVRRASTRLLPVLAAGLLLLAGCADSEDGTAAGVDADAVDELLEDTEPTDDQPEGDDAPPEETDFSGDDSQDFCSVAEELDETVDGFGTSTDPADVKAMMEATESGFERALDVAPDEIANALQTNADAFKLLGDELEKVEYSLIDLDLSVLNQLETEEFEVAEYDLDLYLFEVCEIGDGPTIDDDPLDSEPLPEGSAREQGAAFLVESGFTAAEAECLLERFDFSNPDAFADTDELLAVFTECGIPLERLAQLAG